jgi:hypothetical protein
MLCDLCKYEVPRINVLAIDFTGKLVSYSSTITITSKPVAVEWILRKTTLVRWVE